ncbi:hypothetical protein N568_0102735 [Lactococcus garvieae TRF1]|uniref:Uncharacterized protein n=1 Tax=Lactococcus garvieae TRF1 TaxID=1380772 RepID=V8ATA8_9LACT|nr:hypothetical protein N568_0102735 [Lactococcus garvieae TRF1]
MVYSLEANENVPYFKERFFRIEKLFKSEGLYFLLDIISVKWDNITNDD